MADITNFPKKFSDVVQYDSNKNYTRENVVLKGGNAFHLGDVVAKDSSGKIIPIAPAQSDGTEQFRGIYIGEDIDLTGKSDAQGAILSKGPASVLEEGLDFKTSDSGQKKTIKEAMESAGIRVDSAAI